MVYNGYVIENRSGVQELKEWHNVYDTFLYPVVLVCGAEPNSEGCCNSLLSRWPMANKTY